MGSLARRFLIPKLQRNIVERFSDIINRRSSYFSIPIQTTSYTLWSIYNSIKKVVKHGTIILMEGGIEHDGNKLNMVTSENKITYNVKKAYILRKHLSVAIFKKQKDIELCRRTGTLINQSLDLYLEQVNYRQNGGRITDQAKASINLDDSGNRKYFHTKFHGLSILGKQLNSVLLVLTHSKLTRRTLSYNTREKIKAFRKDKKTRSIN